MNLLAGTWRQAWVALVVLGFCASLARANDAVRVPLPPARVWDFAAGGVHFDNQFSGARLNGCEAINDQTYQVTISPENVPINPSPWYAFRVRAETNQTLALRFVYTHNGPHGRPWLSADGHNWTRAAKSAWRRGTGTNAAELRLDAGPATVWVAAWDMLGLPAINDWMDQTGRRPFARLESAGYSIENRPLRALILSETTNAHYVFVIGRQHPPEITGSIGLMSFVDTLAGDTRLAREYRREFQTAIVPVVNPDGVEHGHWRSNLGGVDLNRDWRAFSQPETVAVRDYLWHYAHAPGARPELFLDFHSTATNVFYAAPPGPADAHPHFTDAWLAALTKDCPDFGFERDDQHNANEPTSKAWAQAALQVPAITCEFGYDTARPLVREAARAEAVEMMRLLLAEAGKGAGAN